MGVSAHCARSATDRHQRNRPNLPQAPRRLTLARDDGAVSSDEGTDDPTTFADLGLRPELLDALTALGYEEPTPIQREAIPPLLGGRDLLGQAATGTGKTAAFALPMLQRLAAGERDGAPARCALVLVPTRELAMQVSEAVHRYGQQLGARVLPIYGGQPIGRQLRALERGVDVVVATPGRALDHIGRGTLDLDRRRRRRARRGRRDARHGLRRGHRGDPRRRRRPSGRRCCSPRRCRRASTSIAKRHLRDPVRIEIEREAAVAGEAPQVRQSAYVVAARAQARRARPHPRRRGARPPRSSSAARATRSTSSPRRSTAAATAPRRCTAA